MAEFPRQVFPPDSPKWTPERINRIRAAHEAAAILLSQGMLDGLADLTRPDPYQEPKREVNLSQAARKAADLLRERNLHQGLEGLMVEERLQVLAGDLYESGRAFASWLIGLVAAQEGPYQIEMMESVFPHGLQGPGVGFHLKGPGGTCTDFALAAGGYSLAH